ncbi:cellulose-binding domain-containing protein [Micromonospora narathiwatensis]|uniref:Cellulose binding domain-containing protein n=1 Tax=Micromonospora narathiwatensis TaxID=299146 RepID=A0A1A8ZJK5_9ACTN|nr:cellulose-binding domain-containing protein [Micromonospora narathiwatensis]SBT44029.1 Cellulose binding domain-containing protein [Micromonospora narathiwatensis]
MRISRARLTPLVATAATLVAAAVVTPVAAGPATAAQGCQIDYLPNEWPGGFTATVRVAPGDTPLNGWTVTWTYPGDQRITSGWNAVVSQSGKTVTARNAAWNGSVPAGGTTEFGVQGTAGTTGPAPTGFALNGVPCNGAPPVPTTAPPTNSPPPTTSPSPTAPPPTRPPTPTPTPTGTPPAGCGAAVLCDGFENQAGPAPAGDWSVVQPDCAGAGTAVVDTATVHTGSRAIRINGAGGYCNHVFVRSNRDLGTLSALRYGRLWVRHTTALPADHVTLLAMTDAADGNRDLRMGGQNGALQWNRASDDATLPEQSPAGVALSVPLPTGRWSCVEFMVDGTTGQLRTWLDGVAVAGLTADGVPTHDIDGQWYNRTWRPRLTDLKLGWESYGGAADTLWFDDVALGSTRLGC